MADVRPGRACPRDLRAVTSPGVHDLIHVRNTADVAPASLEGDFHPAGHGVGPRARDRTRRHQHRLWHREEEMAGDGAGGLPQDPGEPGRSRSTFSAWARSRGPTRSSTGPSPRRHPTSRSTSGRPPAAPTATCFETEWRVKHGGSPDPRRREPRTHADGLRDVESRATRRS